MKNLADELARIGNLLIAENERLTNELLRKEEEIKQLREALEIIPALNGDAKLRKHHALATTGEQPFLWATEETL